MSNHRPPASARPTPSLLSLILWPSLITLGVNIARCTLQVQGDLSSRTGGSLLPLGISWLGFVFGAWFAYRIPGRPQRRGWLIAGLALLAIVAAIAIGFGGLDRQNRGAGAIDQLRPIVLCVAGVGVIGAAACFVAWRRLALACLLYAIPARLTVLALTWLAHTSGWDTHYTKFGPASVQLEDLGATMAAASLAQLGFWVPWTIITGTLTGSLVAARRDQWTRTS